MRFVRATFRDLLARPPTGAYAGGVAETSVTAFQQALRDRRGFGHCPVSAFRACWFALTRNVRFAEDLLLTAGFTATPHLRSQLPPVPGIVFVCTPEAPPSDPTAAPSRPR